MRSNVLLAWLLIVGATLALVGCGTDSKADAGASARNGTDDDASASGSGGAPGGSGGRASSVDVGTKGSGGARSSGSGGHAGKTGTGGVSPSVDAGADIVDASIDAAASNPSGRWVSGYYVGYQRDLYPSEAIDWNALTHLIVGVVTPNADATLNETYDIDATNGPKLAKQLVDLAHQHGKQALAMLGGAGQHDNWVSAASDANRSKLVSNLMELMTSTGYDGFDLDWEPIGGTDIASLKALAQALRDAAPHGVLTIPVGWVSAYADPPQGYYAQLAPLFDQMNLMTYGMAGGWAGWQSWHSSALHAASQTTPTSVESSVDQYLTAGVPASKLGIGIGFFGLCWSPPVTAPKQDLMGSDVVASDNDMSYTNIIASYYSMQDRKWDDAAAFPYLGFAGGHGPKNCGFVSYEDEQSIKAKADYVKSKGLGGTIIWTINQGYLPDAPAGERDPLMDAAKAFL